MALLSELVAACEDGGLDKGATLSMFARRLREARRVSTAGRGRGAAHMTFLDAARFLVACAATDHPEQVVDAEGVFSNLVYSCHDGSDDVLALCDEGAITLDAALSKALRGLSDGTLEAAAHARRTQLHPDFPAFVPLLPTSLVVQRGTASARLRVFGSQYVFQHPATVSLMNVVDSGSREARQVAEAALERETIRFRTGKNLTAELDGTLLRSIADLVGGGRAEVADRKGGANV